MTKEQFSLIDEKIIKTLEWFLSLHEATEIYNMIYNEKSTVEEIESKLHDFRNSVED